MAVELSIFRVFQFYQYCQNPSIEQIPNMYLLFESSNTGDIRENTNDYAHIQDVSNSIKWLQNGQFLEYFNVNGTVITSQQCIFQICNLLFESEVKYGRYKRKHLRLRTYIQDVYNSIKWLQNGQSLEHFNVLGTVHSKPCRIQIYIRGVIRPSSDTMTRWYVCYSIY